MTEAENETVPDAVVVHVPLPVSDRVPEIVAVAVPLGEIVGSEELDGVPVVVPDPDPVFVPELLGVVLDVPVPVAVPDHVAVPDPVWELVVDGVDVTVLETLGIKVAEAVCVLVILLDNEEVPVAEDVVEPVPDDEPLCEDEGTKVAVLVANGEAPAERLGDPV